MPTSLTQHYKEKIKGEWSNPGKGAALSPTPRCSSDWKGSLRVALNYGQPTYLHKWMNNRLQRRVNLFRIILYKEIKKLRILDVYICYFFLNIFNTQFYNIPYSYFYPILIILQQIYLTCIRGTLIEATDPGQSGRKNNINKEKHCSPQSYRTIYSPSDSVL